jgi:hypothetical protein
MMLLGYVAAETVVCAAIKRESAGKSVVLDKCLVQVFRNCRKRATL